jgi:DNA polymerase elongation subunit (family B)
MKFYTNFYARGDTVYIRGYNNGKRFVDQIHHRPTYFVPARKQTEWRTVDGNCVEPIEFDSIRDAKEFERKYDDVDNFMIYGSRMHAYVCANELYGNEYDLDHIKVANIDIEVASEEGFPDPDTANQPVISITISYDNKYYVFGMGCYEPTREDVEYMDCKTEMRLLKAFLNFWEQIDADIITGWNIKGFDIPYLYNRITKILEEKDAKRLSPAKSVYIENIRSAYGKEVKKYTPFGISVLDYLELYKKFTYTQQESYRLDHIATVELGEKKLDYSEYGSLHQLYKTDYQMFIDYNIKDVELVNNIEDKMRLIEQAITIAYDAKVNVGDVFSQVRMWEVLIHNYLIESKVVVPPKQNREKSQKYAGAYVKDPQTGMHKWVMSFDLNSLYPHLIMQYNISPDTFVKDEYKEVSLDKIINREVGASVDDKCLTANGFYYRKDFQGFLPEMMERMYNDRVVYKKKMLEAQAELEEINKQLKELS